MMEHLISQIPEKFMQSDYLFNNVEVTPYIKTAGTVILGWLVVSWIWHIVLILFTPAIVSALAIVLICPSTLEWFTKQLKPMMKIFCKIFMQKFAHSRI